MTFNNPISDAFDRYLLRTLCWRSCVFASMLMGSTAACIQLPEGPYVFEVKITIEQEVLLKVDQALDDIFADQPELFGLPGESQ